MESLCALVDGVGEVMRLVVSVQTRPRPTRDPPATHYCDSTVVLNFPARRVVARAAELVLR